VTPAVLTHVLGREVTGCVFRKLDTSELSIACEPFYAPIILTQSLAVRIFNHLHKQVLKYISQNFGEGEHHFMLLSGVDGAAHPYDINDTYPTGKCGKKNIKASQVTAVQSKSDFVDSAEGVLCLLERQLLKSTTAPRPLRHRYSKDSMSAIMQVLNEIQPSPGKKLTKEDVDRLLVSAEIDHSWTTSRYQAFFDPNGYRDQFVERLDHINDDLPSFTT